jgi:hypothetical protein
MSRNIGSDRDSQNRARGRSWVHSTCNKKNKLLSRSPTASDETLELPSIENRRPQSWSALGIGSESPIRRGLVGNRVIHLQHTLVSISGCSRSIAPSPSSKRNSWTVSLQKCSTFSQATCSSCCVRKTPASCFAGIAILWISQTAIDSALIICSLKGIRNNTAVQDQHDQLAGPFIAH